MKDLPFFDFKVEIGEIDNVLGKAIKDLIANMDERSELKTLTKQIKIEVQDIEQRMQETEAKVQDLQNI